MNVRNVKKTMDQVHISEQMREELIVNIQKQMGSGKRKVRTWKRIAAAAVTFVILAGAASVPVQALVKNIVKARMERISTEDVEGIADMIQGQAVEADSFSREYSNKEAGRMKELWKLYESGTFPEKTILQVEKKEDVPEDTLGYVQSTGEFRLPERELTEEEMLEIIDFQHTMSYAIEQSPAAQAAREEDLEEKDAK